VLRLRGVLSFDHHVVEEPTARAENAGDGFPQERKVMLLQPLVVEPTRELNRQLPDLIFFGKRLSLKRLEPGLEALAADVLADHVETFIPNLLCRLFVIHVGRGAKSVRCRSLQRGQMRKSGMRSGDGFEAKSGGV
jgi:hypothetical protein